MSFNVNAPNRAAMLELAKSLAWPRIKLRRNEAGVADSVGPGIVAWHLFAEQFGDALIAEASASLRTLLEPAPAQIPPPDPAMPAETTRESEVSPA